MLEKSIHGPRSSPMQAVSHIWFFHNLYYTAHFGADHDGLWLRCVHRSPLALQNHHKSQALVLLFWVFWMASVLYSIIQCLVMLQLSCDHSEIPIFFCEVRQVVHHACSDTFVNGVIYFGSLLLGGFPFAGILYYYFKIFFSICAASSAQGNYKAFSTCASHFSVVSLFYCISLGIYLSSATRQNLN
jgi:hypothetical protein